MKTEAEKTNNGGNSARVRISVLGKVNVGKSDLLYRQTINFNNSPVEVEIIDVSGETRDCMLPEEQVQWSDACIVVYSIIDRDSFNYATEILQNLQKMRATSNNIPVILLGNKVDLEHLREVEESDGKNLASRYGCSQFYEISVADNSAELYRAFEEIINDIKFANSNSAPTNNNGNNNGIQKLRKFSVTKMIGTLIGKDLNKNSQYNNQSGTVVVIHRSDLLSKGRLNRLLFAYD